ncbi:ATP-binding cassette domain-containing protein, partial [Candidatus Thioglobus sp.]
LHETALLTGIEGLLDSPLKSLSGGELQRVLLARALLNKPNVLILDEPAQNLDVNGQMHLYKLIQDIHQQQGCAVLMVSHDLHRVMKESTQVLCLYRHICCMGQPETIIKDSQFNDLFADQMDELMATYEHHHNHCHEN